MPKISELNAITTVANNDLLMVVHDPSGLPSTNKITVNNFVSSVSTQLRGYTGSTGAGGGYTGSAGASGYAGSSGSLGYTGSTGSGFTGSAGSAGFTGSTGTAGFAGSAGTNGYTGSAGSGLPNSGYSQGYVLSSNSIGGASWVPNPDVVELAYVDQFGSNTYYATPNNSIIIVDPTAVGNNVTIYLPLADAIEGKRVTVKNISTGGPGPAGPYGYTVTVTTTNPGSNYIEHPITGNFVTSYELKSRADGETWVHDGTIYRHVSSEATAPVFYTDANTYAQVAVKNISSGTEASSDVVLYNDLGDINGDAGPYIDVGINSSGYNNASYNIGGPNDSYVYNKGGDLTIGTANTGTSLILHVGGTTNTTTKWVYNESGSITFPDNTTQNTAFNGTRTLTTISSVGPTTIVKDVTFADPNAAGANVNLILPSSPLSGKVYTVKNINSGGSVVYVQTDGSDGMENESGSIGTGVYATISSSGDYLTWIYDGSSTTYRRIG